MIFDAILIIILYMSFKKAGAKGCTDDLNFAIAFLLSVRLAGTFHEILNGILLNFIKTSENITILASYAIIFSIVCYLYNTLLGKRIVDFGSKIPKKTGTLLTYIFGIFKTIILYSVIFSFLYTIPLVQSIKEKYPILIKPYSYQLTYGVIGSKSEEILERIRNILTGLNLGFFEKQKRIHEEGGNKTLEAIENDKELQNFVTKPKKKKE
ncbi:MAG: CvpA family protein [Candidatus Delongbacteria bacterium]|jgi:uncharacterized membrane protein required for colicin V production|nr:CvpA family protein [Candidatus Delongbacteria bacterium]